jgi:hypothetical protein
MAASRRLPIYFPLALRLAGFGVGVEACQVYIADDELQFEPCFFKPHSVGVLQKYPIDAAKNEYDIRRLNCVPTSRDALDTVQESLPISEDPLEAAQKLFKKGLEYYNSWDDLEHAGCIGNYLEYVLGAAREGGPPLFKLDSLAGLQAWMYVNSQPNTHTITKL